MCAPDRVQQQLSLLEEDEHFIHLATAVVDSWEEARLVYDAMWGQLQFSPILDELAAEAQKLGLGYNQS